MQSKSIVVLGRRDHGEAMRVAAGLTIFGHRVRLVFMTRPVSAVDAEGDSAELLELAEIAPETTVEEMADVLPWLASEDLGAAIAAADGVVSL